MKHLNEDILIKYQFNLLEVEQVEQTANHLAECEQCQKALAATQSKFAVLDVLSTEDNLPQKLIAGTVAKINAPQSRVGYARQSRFLLGRIISVSAAAAAVLIVGLVWLHKPAQKMHEEFAVPQEERLYSKAEGDSLPAMESQAYVPGLPYEVESGSEPAMDSLAVAQAPAEAKVKIISKDKIPDLPPFAPASAIELVVLPKPESMQVTIYNSADLTLVRDTRKLTLKPGWNWLQFMWANTKIDPTSLSIRPLEHADKVEIDQLVFPARLRELGRWLIRSEVEGAVPFEITYFTSGLSWRAVYEGTLSEDESTLDLKGYVRVNNNSGQDYINTQTRLLLGQVRLLDEIKMLADRKYPYGPDFPEERFGYFVGDKVRGVVQLESRQPTVSYDASIKKIEKEGLSEYFLYTIEGTEDLQDAWGKRLESIDISGIPVKSLYKYDEDRYRNHTVRFISFKNDTEHELGQTPLPEGFVKIYRNLNDSGNLSFVGQSAFKYIPVNEDVELNLGGSELVKVEPKLMDKQTDNYIFDPNNNITGWDEIETWQIKITNTRDIPTDIEITRNFGTDYWELELNPKPEIRNTKQIPNTNDKILNVKYEKLDKTRARFTGIIDPQSEKIFTYKVTKYLGQRAK